MINGPTSRLRTEYIDKVMKTGRLCWSDDVERKDKNDQMKYVRCFEVEGHVPVLGSPKSWKGSEGRP